MNRIIAFTAAAASLLLSACSEGVASAPTAQQVEAQKSEDAAESLQFSANAERENIKRRVQLTANPGQIGFILLMNEAGQPIMYESVKGKITSSGKRLNSPEKTVKVDCGEYVCDQARQNASDEGTYGSSAEYIFYWNTDGSYRQWNGKYLYSDKPFRTRVEPLIIAIQQ